MAHYVFQVSPSVQPSDVFQVSPSVQPSEFVHQQLWLWYSNPLWQFQTLPAPKYTWICMRCSEKVKHIIPNDGLMPLMVMNTMVQSKKSPEKLIHAKYTSIAARGGGGSFKRLKLYNSEEHVPIESFVTTLMHWTFFLMTRTKLAFVGFVAAGNSMWHQVLDDLCLVVTDQSATTWDSSYAPNSTQYNSVLQSFEKCYPSTILYYKVLLQKVLLQYYSVLQSTTPVLLRTTKY